jgi:hypothetical protein
VQEDGLPSNVDWRAEIAPDRAARAQDAAIFSDRMTAGCCDF